MGETHLSGLGVVTVVRWHSEQARIKDNIINWILFHFIQVLVLTSRLLLAHGHVPNPRHGGLKSYNIYICNS